MDISGYLCSSYSKPFKDTKNLLKTLDTTTMFDVYTLKCHRIHPKVPVIIEYSVDFTTLSGYLYSTFKEHVSRSLGPDFLTAL